MRAVLPADSSLSRPPSVRQEVLITGETASLSTPARPLTGRVAVLPGLTAPTRPLSAARRVPVQGRCGRQFPLPCGPPWWPPSSRGFPRLTSIMIVRVAPTGPAGVVPALLALFFSISPSHQCPSPPPPPTPHRLRGRACCGRALSAGTPHARNHHPASPPLSLFSWPLLFRLFSSFPPHADEAASPRRVDAVATVAVVVLHQCACLSRLNPRGSLSRRPLSVCLPRPTPTCLPPSALFARLPPSVPLGLPLSKPRRCCLVVGARLARPLRPLHRCLSKRKFRRRRWTGRPAGVPRHRRQAPRARLRD